jgi:hypothetical protein
MDLPPGSRGSGDDDEPGQGLKHSRPGIIGELGLRLLELDTHLGAGDTMQARRAQRRVEPGRDHDDGTQDDDQ